MLENRKINLLALSQNGHLQIKDFFQILNKTIHYGEIMSDILYK